MYDVYSSMLLLLVRCNHGRQPLHVCNYIPSVDVRISTYLSRVLKRLCHASVYPPESEKRP